MSSSLLIVAMALATWGGPKQALENRIAWVDLQKVVSASRAGRAAHDKVAKQHQRLMAELEARGEHVRLARKRWERSREPRDRRKWEDLAGRYQERVEAARQKIDRLEQAELDPILKRLRQSVAKTGALEPRVSVLMLDEYPLIRPAPECDATSALRKSLDAGRATFVLPKSEACAVTRLVAIDYSEALRSSKAGARAARDIEGFRKTKQAELDQIRERAARTKDPEERGALEADLALRYQAHQSRLADKERQAEVQLFDRIDSAVARVRRAHPSVWFVERVEGQSSIACDATRWAAGVLDGAPSTLESLPVACRAPDGAGAPVEPTTR